jgi:hypothetical protein
VFVEAEGMGTQRINVNGRLKDLAELATNRVNAVGFWKFHESRNMLLCQLAESSCMYQSIQDQTLMLMKY